MTDDSNIVLRWEIDNATATLATGRAESGVFNEGGFKWSVIAYKNDDGFALFDLRCDVDHNGPWKCEAEIRVFLLTGSNVFLPLNTQFPVFAFDEDNCVSQQKSPLTLNQLSEWYNINDKITMEFRIRIISSDRGKPIPSSLFAAPNNRSDVILAIGEKKLHVNKEYLSVQSPVFDALFFGDYAEKGKEEVEIKDVIYQEFHDLLELIYLDKDLSGRTVLHILMLADRFQMKGVMKRAESYLIQSVGFGDKLQIADQYRLVKLRDHCLNSFTSHAELIQECQSLEWAGFSEQTKSAIHDRIMKMK